MDLKTIFVKKSEITVTVVKIGTKKLTKSLLDQIYYWLPFDSEYNFIGESIFGYVKLLQNVNGKQLEKLIVVGEKNGNLYKFDLNEIDYIPMFKPDSHFKYLRNNYRLENLCGGTDFINPNYLTEYNELDEDCMPLDAKLNNILKEEGLKNLNRKVENISAFLKEIYKYQVYL